MICPNCGQEIDDHAVFCTHCGAVIAEQDIFKQETPPSDMAYSDQPGQYTSGNGNDFSYQQAPPKRPAQNDWQYDSGQYQYANQYQSPAPAESSKSGKTPIIIVAIIAAAAVAIAACYFLFIAGKRGGKTVTRERIIERQADSGSSSDSSSDSSSSRRRRSSSSTAYNTDDDTYHGSTEYNPTALTDSDGYLMPDSDDEYFSYSDVSGLTSKELSLARNEIYAKHHYTFKSQAFIDFFGGKDWYQGYNSDQEDIYNNYMNSYEQANVNLLKRVEQSKGWYVAP